MAQENGLKYHKLPAVYEVRWAEFTETLLNHALSSWKCLVLFLQAAQKEKKDEPEAKSLLRFLVNLKNIRIIAFLADVFFLFKILQKKLQSNNLTIISMQNYLENFISHIKDMKNGVRYIGGKEEKLEKDLVYIVNEDSNDPDKITLYDIELETVEHIRRGHTNRRPLDTIRNDVIDKIISSMKKRFSPENNIKDVLQPFVTFERDADINQIHNCLASDLNLALLNMQFKDLCSVPGIRKMSLCELLIYLTKNKTMNSEILPVFARIVSATPHSADVERSISANNLLKTSLRNTINISSENNYLFVHFNLPPLSDWTPDKAVYNWLNKKERRNHDLNIGNEAKKTKNQSCFKGVFPQENIIEIDDDNEQHNRRSEYDNDDEFEQFYRHDDESFIIEEINDSIEFEDISINDDDDLLSDHDSDSDIPSKRMRIG